MSRIGKSPIEIPDGVNFSIEGNQITVKGKLGELSFTKLDNVSVKVEANQVIVSVESVSDYPMWGTTRALIANMIEGVTDGYKKSLEINGVGYKFEVSGNNLVLSIGYSHKVPLETPAGLKVAVDEKLKNVVHVTGIDKQLLGQFCSNVRALKKPEPYKGKGIKYVGETIRRKAGKTGAK